MFQKPYPPTSYLIPDACRFRYRTASGAVDLPQVAMVAKLLPVAPDLAESERLRCSRVIGRIQKGVIALGELAEAGLLDERFGFPVIIEVPFGGLRRGTRSDGTTWEQPLDGAAYGFLPDTVARDQEELDVIVGPDPSARTVFVVAQHVPAEGGTLGELDEYKLAVGFPTADAAEACYLANWPAERYGGLSAMPLEVLGGLLGFGPPDTVRKALDVVVKGGVVALADGGVIGRVDMVRKAVWSTAYQNQLPDSAFLYIAPGGAPDEEGKTTPRSLRYFPVRDLDGRLELPHLRNALARIPQADIPAAARDEARRKAERLLEEANAAAEKSAIGVGSFAGGGQVLPTQGLPMPRRRDLLDPIELACRRLKKALDTRGAAPPVPLASRPDMADHPALTAPLAWAYGDPADVGGWLGVLEPEDGSWIAFVDETGHATLWTSRAEDGGVIGEPVEFERPDLVPTGATDKAAPARYDGIDFSVPEGVREEAQRGLDWRAEHGRGGTDVGVATARTLVSEQRVSPEKARHIARYFPRHEVDQQGQGWSPGEDGFPSAGRIAWALWGGDPGRSWSTKLVEQMDSRDRGTEKSTLGVQLLPVAKGLDASTPVSRRIVYGVVLEPEPFGGAGDAHGETYSAEVIEQAAHDYLAHFAKLDDLHGRFLRSDEVVVVESFIAPMDFVIEGSQIRKGAWVLAAKILSDDLWGRVLRGELRAWSIEGYAERECTACRTPMRKVTSPMGQAHWVCPRCDLGGAPIL